MNANDEIDAVEITEGFQQHEQSLLNDAVRYLSSIINNQLSTITRSKLRNHGISGCVVDDLVRNKYLIILAEDARGTDVVYGINTHAVSIEMKQAAANDGHQTVLVI